jgi:hypothetical protein
METQKFSKRELSKSIIKSCGHTHLLNCIAESSGLTSTLKHVFPKDYQVLLTAAEFFTVTSDPMSRLGIWAEQNETPNSKGEALDTQGILDVFHRIELEDVNKFLDAWAAHLHEERFYVYDSSGFGERNGNPLMASAWDKRAVSRINVEDFCVLFGQNSLLPVSFSLYHGREDKLKDLIKFLEITLKKPLKDLTLVLGAAYCIKENLDILLNDRTDAEFLITVDPNTKGVFELLRDKFEAQLHSLSKKRDKYYYSDSIKWGEMKLLVHVMKNRLDRIAAANSAIYNLNDMLLKVSKSPIDFAEDENYADFLSFYRNAGLELGYKVEIKIGAAPKAGLSLGWNILMSNYLRKGDLAVYLFEKWGLIYKTFNSINNSNDLYEYPFAILQSRHEDVERLHQGIVFCAFLSLILISHIDNVMYDKNLYGRMTMQGVFDELSCVKKVYFKNENFVNSLNPKQKSIFRAFSATLSVK